MYLSTIDRNRDKTVGFRFWYALADPSDFWGENVYLDNNIFIYILYLSRVESDPIFTINPGGWLARSKIGCLQFYRV